jgi:hypothetical protein
MFHIHHPEVTFEIWELSQSISVWVVRLVKKQDSPFKFHFVKNRIKDIVRRMPIHAMAQWALLSNEVILFLEDPRKKQVGLVFQ